MQNKSCPNPEIPCANCQLARKNKFGKFVGCCLDEEGGA